MNWPGHRFAFTFFGAVFVAWLLVMLVLVRNVALPAEATGAMLAVFNPGVSETEAVQMISAAQGKIIKQSGVSFAWLVQSDEAGLAGRLKANGAIGAYRELPISIELAGCLAVVDAKVEAVLN